MLKPVTLSVALALALALCASGVSLAGHGCSTCGLASPQGTVVSPQSVVAESCDTCAPKKKCSFKMPHIKFPKHAVTYEWVLKKKHSFHHNKGCDTCGTAVAGEAVYPTSQVAPSSQYAAPSSQYSAPYGAPQAPAVSPAGQTTRYSAPGEMKPALAADEVPPAPTIANGSSLLQLTPSGN